MVMQKRKENTKQIINKKQKQRKREKMFVVGKEKGTQVVFLTSIFEAGVFDKS